MKQKKNKYGQTTSALVAIMIGLLVVLVVFLILREPQQALTRLDNCENMLGTCKSSCGSDEIQKELGDCGKGLVCCVGEKALT